MALESIVKCIADSLGIPHRQVAAAIELLEGGNTVPFIARYRKEATGELDEIALRAIEDALEKENALAARKRTVIKTIEEQGLLTDELRAKIQACVDLRGLEALYLPFKPKRRSRATLARERGLQPLADLLAAQQRIGKSKSAILQPFVNADREVPDGQTALQGALDIVAEQWSEDAATREWLFDQAMKFGKIAAKIKRGKKTAEGAGKFEQYFDRQEAASRIPGHRVLAILRGVSEGFLKAELQLEGDRERSELKRRWVTQRSFEFFQEMVQCADDCFDRLLMPATESSVMGQLKEQADEEAIAVFDKNLRELLMAPPAGPRVTMGIDPGFRTGCKIAVVDGTGKFLGHSTIYPTPPKNDTVGAGRRIVELVNQYDVELIAVGNGTASRETESFVRDVIQDNGLSVTQVMVSESGASIYSASEIAGKEFPDLDITVRGAISIARRLQDPLAELVKTDPKSIGVGQYQHDVNQTRLRTCLQRAVESCVNQVGVDLNMASASLLSHVAGIGPKLAENIVEYRDVHGRFDDRRQLSQVPKLGKRAFEQAAGFLRIRDGKQPLDNSSVHPESYPLVRRMAQRLGTDQSALVGNAELSGKLSPADYVDDQFGLPTVTDILSELGKPGRDPRQEFRAVQFDHAINAIEDLKPGLVLEGVITNVTHFGAFIDLGVHQDGLIHISQLADHFVSDPSAVVSVGQVVKVKVMEVDVARKRISVTRKF